MDNAQWFYADAGGQQQEPVDAETLERLWRDGRIHAQTLLWREGMAGWQPLATLAAELPWVREVAPAAPPPLPAAGVARPAARGIGAGGGCAIAIVLGSFGAVMILGVLAAIAIPAYQDYTHRAKVAVAIGSAASLKERVMADYRRLGDCPVDIEVDSSDVPDGFSEIWVGRFEDETCGIQLVFEAIPGLVDSEDKKLWLWLDESGSGWKCSSELPNRVLPQSCRG